MTNNQKISFIGGGRVTELLLFGLKHKSALPERVLVSDPDASRLKKITEIAPELIQSVKNNQEAAQADLVFLAVHPPVLAEVAEEIKGMLKPDTILISLVPTISIQRLSGLLNGFTRIVRMIPNAPSVIGKGFNPLVFSETFNDSEKAILHALFENWGESPEVPEKHLEAYAILTGMGPTYFWFQWLELQRLAKEFGLEEDAARKALNGMLTGAVEMLYHSGLPAEKVLDLIPAYPLKKKEDTIRQIFSERLTDLFQKLNNIRK